MRERDTVRRDADREAYRLRQEAARAEQTKLAAAGLIDRFFPFAKAAWERATGGSARERLRQALASMEGVVLGAASIGVPALLALKERIKHLFIVGRSGGGKTTILVRILTWDLARDVAVLLLGSESEFFREQALGLVPEDRIDEVVYFRPADPNCGLVWNPLIIPPGVDHAVAAGQLFTAIKRALGETEIGARADAILASALAVMIGRPDGSLLTLNKFLEDETYRASVVETVEDPYLHSFWTTTAAEFPSSAVLPIVTRLSRFLRVPQVRAALCGPVSTASPHEGLSKKRNMVFDFGGRPRGGPGRGRIRASRNGCLRAPGPVRSADRETEPRVRQARAGDLLAKLRRATVVVPPPARSQCTCNRCTGAFGARPRRRETPAAATSRSRVGRSPRVSRDTRSRCAWGRRPRRRFARPRRRSHRR